MADLPPTEGDFPTLMIALRKRCRSNSIFLWLYALASIVGGILCLMSADRFWFGWSIPMIVFGCFVAAMNGMRLWKLSHSWMTTQGIHVKDEIIRRLDHEIRVVLRVVNSITVVFGLVMIILVLSIVIKWSEWLTGLCIATVAQAGIIVMLNLVLRFWLEITRHEIARN